MKNLLLSTLLLLVSCANAGEASLPAITVNDICLLSIEGSITPTALEGSCTWAVDSDGKLKTNTVNNEKIAILIGTKITAAEMKEWNLQNFAHCSFQSIGVEINEAGEPTAFSHPIKDLLVCSDLHIDKKVFSSYKWD